LIEVRPLVDWTDSLMEIIASLLSTAFEILIELVALQDSWEAESRSREMT